MGAMEMRSVLHERLTAHVNRKKWWHVPPVDPNAYQKRGKFLASTYEESEFWGRPLDDAERVTIAKPLVGDEKTIERRLFGQTVPRKGIHPIKERFALDAKMKRAALAKGYDSIVLMSPKAFCEFRSSGKLPRSIELNILKPRIP
jgi:hypothetical protein